MEEFSLYVLDIAMNSVRAKAKNITIRLEEKNGMLYFSVKDDGCGMTEQQVKNLSDPFYTTRKTRKVGLGIPFLTMLAENTGGKVEISSKSEAENKEEHGTVISASFGFNHIDFIPVGSMADTLTTLIQGSPEINFTFDHIKPSGSIHLSCLEMKEVLGDGIPLNSPEVLIFIGKYLKEQYEAVA